MFSDIDHQTKVLLNSDPETIEAQPHPTVTWELSKSDALPPNERIFKRLAVEANGLVAARFETTSGYTNVHDLSCAIASAGTPEAARGA